MSGMQECKWRLTKSAARFLSAGLILIGIATPLAAQSQSLKKTFEFGPGTPNHHSNYRTLLVPPNTTIGVAVKFTAGSCSKPVIIDIHQTSAASIGTTGPDGPLLDTSGSICPSGQFFFSPTYFSSFGCPSTWRVRVRTQDNLAPAVACKGEITFVFTVPAPTKFHLNGQKTLDPNVTLTTNLGTPIGSGTFRIKSIWHTDFFSGGLNFFKLKVDLLKPNNVFAAGETGFSQHAPSDKTPKVDFTYVMTNADVSLTGAWKLRITNGNSVKFVNFDIENGFAPTFSSTHTPGCSGFPELAPEDQSVTVHEPVNYAYTWTVPEPFNWHDLQWLQLRIRDGENIALWVRWDDANNTFSQVHNGTGTFGPDYAPGSKHKFQTPEATLDLADTTVVGSGPTGTSVTLNLALALKPKAAGHAFVVEAAGLDTEADLAEFPDFFTPVGTLLVTK